MNNNLFINGNEDDIKNFIEGIIGAHPTDADFGEYLLDQTNSLTRIQIETHVEQCDVCRDKLQILTELRLEGQGELDNELATRIRKRLAFISLGKSINKNKPEKQPGVIGTIKTHLSFLEIGLGLQFKAKMDWAEIRFINDLKEGVYTYREDAQRNLLFRFTIFSPKIKAVQLLIGNQILADAELIPEGNEWIGEAVVTFQTRSSIQRGDEIEIRLVSR